MALRCLVFQLLRADWSDFSSDTLIIVIESYPPSKGCIAGYKIFQLHISEVVWIFPIHFTSNSFTGSDHPTTSAALPKPLKLKSLTSFHSSGQIIMHIFWGDFLTFHQSNLGYSNSQLLSNSTTSITSITSHSSSNFAKVTVSAPTASGGASHANAIAARSSLS